jgi:hypothetical protein
MGNHTHGDCPNRGNFRFQHLLVAGFSKGWNVTADEYRQKAERYLAYARRMKNQDAKDTEPVRRVAKQQRPTFDRGLVKLRVFTFRFRKRTNIGGQHMGAGHADLPTDPERGVFA